MIRWLDENVAMNGKLETDDQNLPMTLRIQCVHSNIMIENMSIQGQTCAFSNTPHSLEAIQHSPFTANDRNQTLDEWIANGIQNTYDAKHVIPKI